MSKKFSKTILSSAVAGLMLVSSGAMAAEPEVINVGDGTQYQIKIFNNGASAEIYDVKNKSQLMGAINTVTGKVTTVNAKEVDAAIKAFEASLSKEQKELYDKSADLQKATLEQAGYTYRYSIDVPLLKADKLNTITVDDVNNIKSNIDTVSTVITSKTAADYNQAVSNGMSSEAALAAASSANGGAMLHEFSRIGTNITNNTKAIQSNSRQLQEHNARLNDHQRQIRENHEEMKRAAAQSAALAGLFQPYSVGKFNATAALGGYSDKQAVAVGVGYRF
ncbi:YadA-like family protein, partial [Escherichia coli]|nr:YadA-like family protein [Escherichia coli]